jgi:C4-dicarboxylate-specific signal transduction histidine kinase
MTGTSKLIQYSLVISFFTLMLITSTVAMQIQLAYAQVNINNTNSNNSQNNILITNILAKNLENRIQKAGAILEITSKSPQVRDAPYADLLNQTLTTLHGIPQQADIEKRQVAKNILSSNSDLYEIFLLMPNGDMYFLEPYSIQQTLAVNNYAFRDYFQGAIKTNDTYLGNVHTTAAASGVRTAKVAVPVYSLKDNSTIVGVWAGSIDFGILNKELQSLNLTSLDDNARVVYVDSNGQKVADSDVNKSTTPESFANLNSFKAAIRGQTGSTIDTVNNNTKMLVTYQPVNAFHNTWAVLLIQPPTPQ